MQDSTTAQPETIASPTPRIAKWLYKEDAANIQKGEPGYGSRGYIEAYGLDGVCEITIEGLPPCARTHDTEWDDDGNESQVPHKHVDWCESISVDIPFVLGPSRLVKWVSDNHVDERNAWGWNGDRTGLQVLSPSFLFETTHSRDGEESYPVRFHCFVGMGGAMPGDLNVLGDSHIEVDGRRTPILPA